MTFVTSLALGLATLQVAIASPVAESPPLITPSPVLQRRGYDPDFVGYVLVSSIGAYHPSHVQAQWWEDSLMGS